MSKGSKIRAAAQALTAYRLSKKGLTVREIQERLGLSSPHTVKARILLGERLAQQEKSC